MCEIWLVQWSVICGAIGRRVTKRKLQQNSQFDLFVLASSTMTSRNRNNVKIETTIETCRSEGKWQRVIELAEELKSGSPDYGKVILALVANVYSIPLS